MGIRSKTFAVICGSAGLVLLSCGDGSVAGAGRDLPGTSPGSGYTVIIEEGAAARGEAAFGTNPLEVPAGETVTWVNSDSHPHSVVARNGEFDSGVLDPGDTFSHRFSMAGDYEYSCEMHSGMKGRIRVRGDGVGRGPTPHAPNSSGSGEGTPAGSTPRR